MSERPAPVAVLPDRVSAEACGDGAWIRPTGCWLPLGLGGAHLAPIGVEVPAGEHLMVVGPARSGRTGALDRLAASWCEAGHRCGVTVSLVRWAGRDRRPVGELRERIDSTPPPLLVVVDDADLVDDPDGWLGRLVAGGRSGVTVAASGRPGPLRAAYGHWTQAVRRSRLGLLLDGADELDADLLGAVLPRHRVVPLRPGRGWLVVDGVAVDLVQVAASPAGS